jgi:two-component system cell cycle response regulator
VMITDAEGHVVRMNRELLVLIGGAEALWLGRSMDELLTPASRIFNQTHLFPMLHHAKSVREVFVNLRGVDGETIPVMVNAVSKPLKNGPHIVWAIFVARERSRFEGELIKARSEAQGLAERLATSNEQVALQNRQLSELSLSDPLTGLKNRRALELTVQSWQRTAFSLSSVSLLMMDVDYFKRINDAHGHPEGDRVLVAFARHLQAGARGSDLVARYGGEEFAERVHQCAKRVRSAAGPVTVSVGLAYSQHHTEADFLARLLKRADEAVYRAKALGRNCTVVSD